MYNGNKFSVYTSEEKTVLRLIKELGDQTNFNTEEKERIEIDYTSKFESKTDKTGDHKGTWQGLNPSQTNVGISALVNKHTDQIEKNSTLITNNQLNIDLTNANVSANTKAITSIGSATPKGIFTTVALLTSAYPTGNNNVYVISVDGKWYYWGGTSWLAGGIYQSTGIAKNSVNISMLTETLNLVTNLFDKNSITVGMQPNESNGALIPTATVNTTDYIPCLGLTTYSRYVENIQRVLYFDVNQTFIGGIIDGENISFTTPYNCKYFRAQVNDSILDTDMFFQGIIKPNKFIPYGIYKGELSENFMLNGENLIIDSIASNKLKKQSVTLDKLDDIINLEMINLFDKNATLSHGVYFLETTGNPVADLIANMSDFIPVTPNTIYNKYNAYVQRVIFYNASKIFLSGIIDIEGSTKQFITPANCYYVKCQINDAQLDTEMVVKGSVIPTVYTPYGIYKGELGPNITINGNNIKDGTFPEILNLQLQGKTCNFVGDSITDVFDAGFYVPLVCEETGLLPNYMGLRGSCIAINNAYVPNKSFVERVSGINGNVAIVDADIWIIFGGYNDQYYSSAIGDMSSVDNNTVYGALKTICQNIILRPNNPELLLITPLQSNRNGAYMDNLIQAMKDVGKYYSIPVLDLFSVGGISPLNSSRFTTDGLHPTMDGTVKSGFYKRIIESLINNVKG